MKHEEFNISQLHDYAVLTGDCVENMRKLPEQSVQCVVTSPPYDDLRQYDGHCEWDFRQTAEQLMRLLVPGGIICWNVQDGTVKGSKSLTSFRQAIYFKELGFRHHDTIIWHKPNFAHPDATRYHQLFEYIFIISKGKPRVFNPICDKQNVYAGTGTFGANTARQRNGEMKLRKRNINKPFGKRGNVWRLPTSGQENVCQSLPHPAMMGYQLCRDLVISYSNQGDIVLDPFAGSGTTGQVAIELGRKAVLCELNPNYVRMIHDRCHVTPGLPL